MEKPTLSPAFNVDDIGKLREWNHEYTKHMTDEERRADTKRRADEMRELIAASKSRNESVSLVRVDIV